MKKTSPEIKTASPINIDSIKGQCRRLYDYLMAGNSITMFEAGSIGVGYLNSRISDLRNKCNIHIEDKMIYKNGSHVKEYSIPKTNTQ